MKKTRIKRFIVFVAAILLASLLLYSLYKTQNEQRDISNRMYELQQLALPYEKELEALKLSLKELQTQIIEDSTPDRGRVLIGCQLSTFSDIYSVEEMADDYLIQPVLIIDCALPESELNYLLSVLKSRTYEVVFTATPLTEAALLSVASIRQAMLETELIDTGTFLLRGVDDTEANLDLLAKNGYTRCLRFINNYPSETLDNGLTCFGFGYLNSRNVALKTNLQNAAANKTSNMYVFDFSTWTMSKDDRKAMASYFDTINAYTGDGSLLASTVEESFETIRQFTILKAERQAANEIAMQEINDKITELELKIRKIYADGDAVLN